MVLLVWRLITDGFDVYYIYKNMCIVCMRAEKNEKSFKGRRKKREREMTVCGGPRGHAAVFARKRERLASAIERVRAAYVYIYLHGLK